MSLCCLVPHVVPIIDIGEDAHLWPQEWVICDLFHGIGSLSSFLAAWHFLLPLGHKDSIESTLSIVVLKLVPVNALEEWMTLNLFNAVTTKSVSWDPAEEPLQQVFQLG